MTKKDLDIPGNAVGTQLAFQKELYKEGLALRELTDHIGWLSERDFYITSLKFQMKSDDGTDVLLIVSGHGSEGHKVAFVGGSSVSDCCRTMVSMLRNERLRWQDDKYHTD